VKLEIEIEALTKLDMLVPFFDVPSAGQHSHSVYLLPASQQAGLFGLRSTHLAYMARSNKILTDPLTLVVHTGMREEPLQNRSEVSRILSFINEWKLKNPRSWMSR
jgi:hypothetical protein